MGQNQPFVCHMQIKKLVAGVSHAADFGHALLDASFVAGKIGARQLAFQRQRTLRACPPARK
jgi:hypothetical protein